MENAGMRGVFPARAEADPGCSRLGIPRVLRGGREPGAPGHPELEGPAAPSTRAVSRHAALLVVFLALVSWTVSGCSSGKSERDADLIPKPVLSESNQRIARGCLSAVEIHGQKEVTVRETVESVFTEAGFKVGVRKPEFIAFDRVANRSLVVAYGNWNGMEVRARLKVEIIPQSDGQYLLVCRSFVVREAGSMSEDEQPLARRRLREYEHLLYEVGNRLN